MIADELPLARPVLLIVFTETRLAAHHIDKLHFTVQWIALGVEAGLALRIPLRLRKFRDEDPLAPGVGAYSLWATREPNCQWSLENRPH